MHIKTRVSSNGTRYYSIEESYRQDGQIKKRKIANLGRASKLNGKPGTAIKRLKALNLAPEQIHKFLSDIAEKDGPDQDCWQTPNTPDFPIVSLVKEMFHGTIGLDPTTIASNPTRAKHFFTMRDNCLWQSWEGKGPVFMNPPFSGPVPFLEKLIDAYRSGDIPSAVTLLPSRCRQDKAAGVLLRQSDANCIWHERIQYVDAASGELVKGINFPSSLDYYGKDTDRFREIFSPYGEVR